MNELWASIVAIVIIIIGAIFFNYARCNMQAISFKHYYGPIQGCMIETKDGKWIPFENYREIAQ